MKPRAKRKFISLDDVSTLSTLMRLEEIADELREIADGLRGGTLNQWHAANKITKRANEISRKGE